MWRQVRNDTDPAGGRHVFYRQYYVSGSTEAEMYGSEIGLHYWKSGALWAIAGHQFRSATVSNRPVLTSGDAVARVLNRQHGSFHSENTENVTLEQRAHRQNHSKLKLVPETDGFRYAWFTFANDDRGVYHQVVLDAETEQILSVGEVNPHSNCAATTAQPISAQGLPVRQELRNAGVVRWASANASGDRPAPFTDEAFSTGSPSISVFQRTDTDAFQCFRPGTSINNVTHTLFPLLRDDGLPIYRDRIEYPEWRGYAAGDALFHTRLTMQAFEELGRGGWDNAYGPANVLIESPSAPDDTAYFKLASDDDPDLPAGPVVVLGRQQRFHAQSASLDHIAHEWGHGVIETSARFPYSDPTGVGAQLHEGFADVIGQIVEKMKQTNSMTNPPAGSANLEDSADWVMHEDGSNWNGPYLSYERGAVDDELGHTRLGPGGSTDRNDSLHRDDPGSDNVHSIGNRLHVVLRLLTEGGRNPICNRVQLSGCSTTVNALGFNKARRILFDTVQFYATSRIQWEELVDVAKFAAYSAYQFCPTFNAQSEQNAVNRAFTAIGYPSTQPNFTCGP